MYTTQLTVKQTTGTSPHETSHHNHKTLQTGGRATWLAAKLKTAELLSPIVRTPADPLLTTLRCTDIRAP